MNARERLTGSLWFVPGLIVMLCAVLAVLLVLASTWVDGETLARYPRLFGADAESSRSMLSTIASSIITVAGVTFSITVLAVSQASSQYTPRVLRNFMGDRPSQITLGVLVGVFVYCLIVMRTVRGGDEDPAFVPAIATLGAFVLAIIAIGCLVYFLHNIASTLEAGSIIARVSEETVAVVRELFPEALGEAPEADERGADLAGRRWYPIPARFTGYLQEVDEDGLLRLAREHSIVVRMERAIGDFVAVGVTLASVADRPASDQLAQALGELCTAKSYRTVHQDAAFGLRQMVDIALKALSPGVNDSTTAATCVDYIGAVLVRLADRAMPSPHRVEAGELRVIARAPTFTELMGNALDEIRRNAAGNARVLARMLDVLAQVAAATASPARHTIVREHAARILRAAEREIPAAEDRQWVVDGCEALEGVLERAARASSGGARPP